MVEINSKQAQNRKVGSLGGAQAALGYANPVKSAAAAGAKFVTGFLLKLFAVSALLVAVGIVAVEAKTAAYARISELIWQNHPYAPNLIIDELNESAKLSPMLACASGSAIDRATIALRALDDALAGQSDLSLDAALPIAVKAVDDGLACRPLSAQLWLGRFWSRALGEGFRPSLRDSYDRSIATAPYDGWIMRLRTQIGSRWFYALSDNEQRKFFEDLRYTIDMGFLDDAFAAVERLSNQPERLKREIDLWPLDTRNRFARFPAF